MNERTIEDRTCTDIHTTRNEHEPVSPGEPGVLRRAAAVAAGTVVATTAALAFATTTAAPASAAENDYQSDPDCMPGSSGIPADIVTRAVDGWRFSGNCHNSYSRDGLATGSANFHAVFVSDQDIARTAHVRFFCAATEPGKGFVDKGSLRGIAADGSEVFRIEAGAGSTEPWGSAWPGQCSDTN